MVPSHLTMSSEWFQCRIPEGCARVPPACVTPFDLDLLALALLLLTLHPLPHRSLLARSLSLSHTRQLVQQPHPLVLVSLSSRDLNRAPLSLSTTHVNPLSISTLSPTNTTTDTHPSTHSLSLTNLNNHTNTTTTLSRAEPRTHLKGASFPLALPLRAQCSRT